MTSKYFIRFFVITFFCCAFGGFAVFSNDFISVKKIDGKWWLTKAEKGPFVTLGINHVEPQLMIGPHNIENTYQIYGADFTYWHQQFNPHGSAAKSWLTEVKSNFTRWGFDAFGYHTPVPYDLIDDFHYIALIRAAPVEVYCPNQVIPDVFSKTFHQQVDKAVAVVTKAHANSPNLLGYAFSDVPFWHFDERNKQNPWVTEILSLGPQSAGKKTWIELLKQHYQGASEAGATYGIEVSSWEELLVVKDWSAGKIQEFAMRDKEAFLLKIIEEWCKTHHDAVRKYDKHHLILGDKLWEKTHSKAWEIIAKYYDVIYIQWYADFETQKDLLIHIHEATGKPILMGDSSFSVVKPYQDGAKGVKVASQDAVGDAYYDYLKSVMGLPFVVGWHYCGYMEGHRGMNSPDCCEDIQSGFLDPWGNPFEYTLQKVTEANRLANQWHANAR